MNYMETTGVVTCIDDTVERNGFCSRKFVLNTKEGNSKYDNLTQFTLKKDRCEIADRLNAGDRIKVSFTIDGRKWDGPNGTRYFTDLNVWKIELLDDNQKAEAQPPQADETADDFPF